MVVADALSRDVKNEEIQANCSLVREVEEFTACFIESLPVSLTRIERIKIEQNRDPLISHAG